MNCLHHKLKEHIRMVKNQASNIKRNELIVNRKKNWCLIRLLSKMMKGLKLKYRYVNKVARKI